MRPGFLAIWGMNRFGGPGGGSEGVQRLGSSMFLGRHWGWWGDTIAAALLILIGLIGVFALIGLYARRIWSLPTHMQPKQHKV